MSPYDIETLKLLDRYKRVLYREQYKVLKGQVLSGDSTGARRGLDTILRKRKGKGEDHPENRHC